MADPNVLAAVERGNPVVFFDVSLGSEEATVGRIKMELFAQDCPKTSENFRQFCTGEFLRFEQPTGYKNSTFHRVIKGFVLQGGDIVNHDGACGCTLKVAKVLPRVVFGLWSNKVVSTNWIMDTEGLCSLTVCVLQLFLHFLHFFLSSRLKVRGNSASTARPFPMKI